MIEDYAKAKRIGDRECRKAVCEGRYPYLLSLDSIAPDAMNLSQEPLGIKEIPISMIAGTVTAGRQNAFSYGFMPILAEKSEFATKWSHLYDSQKKEGIHDPILCYEYMNRFYVQEGNKRVSVTKFTKGYSVAADVRRLIPKKTNDPEVIIYYEFLDFYAVTGLFDITFSKEGSYLKLAELYWQDLKKPWPDEVKENLHQDFLNFDDVYEHKGGEHMGITVGDAFLKYLSIYRPETIRNDSKAEIARKMATIWNEFETTANENALVEEPVAVGKTAATNVIESILGKQYTTEHPLRVAFIFSSNPEDSSWAYGHELGRNEVQSDYGGIVDTIRFDNCRTEPEVDKAFDTAALDKDDVVIATSETMMDAALRASVNYPNMKILNCSINLASSAVRTYYPKMYEAKFLMGALAASLNEGHKIGYVADSPIYGNIASINAFALGAALADPKSEIYLKWTGVKDSDWEADFRKEGVHLISGMDFIRPKEASRKYGVYHIADDGKVENIAAPMLHWGAYYKLIIDSILNGNWNSRETVKKSQALNYWFGLKAGVIDLILSQNLPYYSGKLVNFLKQNIMNGVLDPFGGELRSQDGIIHKADDPALTNEQIITMNWLNDNVIGKIPVMREMSDAAKETVAVSGVSGTEKSQE